MLKKAKQELERERRQKHEHQKKVELQKAQRDVMLLEAQKKKITEFQKLRNNELTEVKKLQEDIKKEKNDKKQKKLKELEAAQKVIEENELDRIQRIKDKENAKLEQIKLQEEYNRMLDKQDKYRAEQKAARDEKIMKIINRMGEVFKKSDTAERAHDKRILEQQLLKDKEAEKAEKQKKDRARQQNLRMLEELDQQIVEKQKQKEKELKNNQKYIKMVISQDESDKKKQRDDEAKAAAKRKQV